MKLNKNIIVGFVVILLFSTLVYYNIQQVQRNNYEEIKDYNTYGYINTDFPNNYIKKNKREVLVEIPKVYELYNIVTAISKSGQSGEISLNKYTDYYTEVMNYFGEYSDHPAVKKYEELRKEYSYSHMRLIFSYDMDENQILDSNIYRYENNNKDTIEFLNLLEDFAKKSNFDNFYNIHKEYYQKNVENFKNITDLKSIWSWLENNFPDNYHSYKVILSPLVYGSHNTASFYDKEDKFHEMVMFVSTVEIFRVSDEEYKKLQKALVERMVFTEIDHNYVNPITDKDENKKLIAERFSNLDDWNQQDSYDNSLLTFNEYMTWSVACIYTYENYDQETYNEFFKYTVNTMNVRGFIKFEEFHKKLLELYKSSDEPIYELYPDILDNAQDI